MADVHLADRYAVDGMFIRKMLLRDRREVADGCGRYRPNMCHESDSTGLARPSLWSVPHASAIVSDALSASVGGAQVAE